MDDQLVSIPGWKIIREIGKGGFGCVYEVEKEGDFGGVAHSAMKVISIPEHASDIEEYRQEGLDDVSLTALFKSQVEDITSEFRLMSKLKGCSNIVSFEDHWVVQHEKDPGYDIFIRMELLTPLLNAYDRELKEHGYNDSYLERVGVDICRALERCARHNIIHRDIKPQNIFVNGEGDFKLGDFGIAKTSNHTTRATQTGTPNYMAPEVYLSKPYNASVDIYSLGLVLYWMLNERRGPFLPLPPAVPKPSQNAEALDRRMSGEPLPAPKHGSEELKRIVLKACAFDPKDRYANPTEMKRDLERLTLAADIDVPFADTAKKQADVDPCAAEDEKTYGVYGVKPQQKDETPVVEEEKTFGIFNKRQPRFEERAADVGDMTVAAAKAKPPKPKTEADSKPIEKPKDSTETEKVQTEPEQKTQPVQKETKPVETENRKKKSKLPVILSIAAAVVIAAVVLIVEKPSQTAEQPTAEPVVTAAPTPTPKPTPTPTPDLVVEFQDAALEEAFRKKYGYTGEIYQSDILGITKLELAECNLSDVSDLAQFTNLTYLNLYDNQISDISPLRDLTGLTDLELFVNPIGDLSPLEGLTNLTFLYIGGREMDTDISVLRNLKNLSNLKIQSSKVSDISALQELIQLTSLSIHYNFISDVTALKGLTNLTYLNLNGNPISDVTPLQGLTNLTELSLNQTKISKQAIEKLKAVLPNCKIDY